MCYCSFDCFSQLLQEAASSSVFADEDPTFNEARDG
jgi:hypothetical protein